MKTAFDVVKGKIISVSETGRVLIECQYDDWYTLTKRGYSEVNVQMIDSRPLSDKQRRACYAMIRAISDWSGEGESRAKHRLKTEFLLERYQETADTMFSLSNAPMSLVCEFQAHLVDVIVSWDVPCSFPLLDFVDDIQAYVHSCLINKKCCVCGRAADLHHVDRVGMGRDRDEIIHEGMEAMPLCRKHHDECHTLGQQSFNERYHFDGGIVLDGTLCKIYGLNRRKKQ
jgi:Protein of unknown function (DUF968).